MFVLQAYIINKSYRHLTPIYRHAKDEKKLERKKNKKNQKSHLYYTKIKYLQITNVQLILNVDKSYNKLRTENGNTEKLKSSLNNNIYITCFLRQLNKE